MAPLPVSKVAKSLKCPVTVTFRNSSLVYSIYWEEYSEAIAGITVFTSSEEVLNLYTINWFPVLLSKPGKFSSKRIKLSHTNTYINYLFREYSTQERLPRSSFFSKLFVQERGVLRSRELRGHPNLDCNLYNPGLLIRVC